MNKKVLIIAFLLNSVIVSGQMEKLLVPTDLKQQTIVTEPITLRKGYIRPGVAMSYGFVDKYFNSKGKREYYPESSFEASYFLLFMVDYGLTDRIQIEAQTEYNNTVQVLNSKLVWPELDTNALSHYHNKGKGIGDSYLGVKYLLVKEADNRPSLSGEVQLTIPTGRKNPANVKSMQEFDPPTGYGCFDLDFTVRTKYIRYPYSLTGYVDYIYAFAGSKKINATDPGETKFKYGNRIEAGAGFDFQVNDWIAMAHDIVYENTGKGKIEYASPQAIDASWAISYEVRLIFQVKRFRIGEGVRVPLKGKTIGADPQYVILTSYVF